MAEKRVYVADKKYEQTMLPPMSQVRIDLRNNALKERLLEAAKEYPNDELTVRAIIENRNCDFDVQKAVLVNSASKTKLYILDQFFVKLDYRICVMLTLDENPKIRKILADKTQDSVILQLLLRLPENEQNKEAKKVCLKKIKVSKYLREIKKFLSKVSDILTFQEYLDALLKNPNSNLEDILNLLKDLLFCNHAQVI